MILFRDRNFHYQRARRSAGPLFFWSFSLRLFWSFTVRIHNDRSIKGAISNAEIKHRLEGNIMDVGLPDCWNLKALCNQKEIKMPRQFRMWHEEYEFWLVQSAFAFIPAPGSQFKWARIVTSLESLSENYENPIVYDAFPKNIFNETDQVNEVNIGLNFKFKTVVEARGNYVQKIELTKLNPMISVAGIGKKNPTWDFSGQAAFCLQDINTLYMIIKTPVNFRGLKLSFYSHAEISTKWGGVFCSTSKPKEEEAYEIFLPESHKI